jgi:hypothetical protein
VASFQVPVQENGNWDWRLETDLEQKC